MKDIIGAKSGAPPPQVKTLTVDDESAGQRLDNFLLRHLKGVPKTHVYRIIRSGEVRINKGRVAADTRVQAGDLVRVPPVRVSDSAARRENAAPALAAPAPARDFAVLYEDDYLLAINKPAGVAVHGGSGVSFGVIEQLRRARPQARYLELVHRLDRETSGILLVAKRRSALVHLQDQFRARDTGKTYLALVPGHWPASRKVLDKPLVKYLIGGDAVHEGERRVRVASRDDPDAMPALTLVKVRSTTPVGAAAAYSLLEVTIKTGRTHQIRVHLASEGFPIVGDDKYGNFDLNHGLARQPGAQGLRRMFLHAWKLHCKHPSSGEPVQLQAELPSELQTFVQNVFPA